MSIRACDRPRLIPPPREDFWVFGYGSLMWHPGFPHVEVRVARLHGYHRRFCITSHRYRGTPDCPGLVLGLDRGGSCGGLVYRVPAAEGAEVMDYLWEREMVTGVYIPSWLKVATEHGPVNAATFVVDRTHEQYCGRLSLEETARMVEQGRGDRGACLDYLTNTVHHLESLGVGAGQLKQLLRAVKARPGDT
ncbi:MAG: gamma-glutamylcyclotransferase [Pseudomonadota bacterium]